MPAEAEIMAKQHDFFNQWISLSLLEHSALENQAITISLEFFIIIRNFFSFRFLIL
jgi:hypothetical protein